MRVLVLVKATNSSEAGEMPNEDLIRAMGDYCEMLVNEGILLDGDGLHPSSTGYRVRFSGDDRMVTPGPFPQIDELVAGFWIWRVDSMEDAIEWVKKCPNPMLEGSDIEIRRIHEEEDFGEAFTPELQERERRIRDEADRLKSK